MTPYRCTLLDMEGRPAWPDIPIDAMGIDPAIERALEALMERPGHVGFEIHDDVKIVHRYIRPRRDF